MTVVLPVVLEIFLLAGLYLLSVLIARPLRARSRAEEGLPLRFGVALRAFLARVSRSVSVLLLSHLALFLGHHNPAFARWMLDRGAHLTAWFSFWTIVLFLAAVEGALVLGYRIAHRPFPVPQLLRNIIWTLLTIAALFAILRFQLGINIAPLLASTALLTAVLGFALQGVLGNLLAGMSLHIVRSVVPGDWVAIDRTEGEVIETNWRETRLRTVSGHIMVVPNSTVASSLIHNMSHPTPLRRHAINVGASYSDAPGDVIAALVESALALPEVLHEPAPDAYVTEYKDFGINYVLRFWTRRYYNRTPLEGDVARMIWYQFKRRGIEIPFPMSDKLLNDFMEVVYNQRRLPPEEMDVKRTQADLMRSDFMSKALVDEQGKPLLREEDLAELAPTVRRIRYTRGETVFRQGNGGDACYVVVSGRVHGRVEYEDGRHANEFDLGPGALFGEMTLTTGLPRTATITAPEEVELLEISRETFTKLLELRGDVPQILAKLVAERAAQNSATLEKLKALGTANVAESIKRENILKRFLRMIGV